VPRIFISHAGSDSGHVFSLAKDLERQGYAVFLDFEHIPGGSLWERELFTAMKGSQAVLLYATPDAVASQWVFAELVLAEYAGVPIIPMVFKECELPGVLDTKQRIDFTRSPADAYDKLWKSLERFRSTQDLVPWPPSRAPYAGLSPLQEFHSPVFFGRDRELETALARLWTKGGPRRVLCIVGPSGSGKSSLVFRNASHINIAGHVNSRRRDHGQPLASHRVEGRRSA
jgi:hypothetical protein